MGCFSFLCKESGRPALSTSFDGSPCYLFLLKNGEVIEEMYGNYDSYGRVFKKGKDDAFKWNMPWTEVCDLMFDKDESNGIAMVLADEFTGKIPTTRSEGDPNQGWGDPDETEDEYWVENAPSFPVVKEPYHKVHRDLAGNESGCEGETLCKIDDDRFETEVF